MKAAYNPFNPNGIVPTSLFAGRTQYCVSVLKRLSETKHGRASSFFLHGERGIGKSALARLISDIAKSRDPKLFGLNFVTAYYPIEPDQSFRSVLESSLNSLTDSMPELWLKRLTTRLGDIFKNGKFSFGAYGVQGAVEAAAAARSVAVRDEAISVLSNIVTALRESEEKRDGLLIVIDEVQNLSDIQVAAPMIRGILSALDFKQMGQVSFMLIGLDQAYENFILGDVSAQRTFDRIRLDVMPPIEAIDALKRGFEDVQLKWDAEILESRIHVTGGYPHSIQVLGRNLVDVDSDGMIDEADWTAAVEKTTLELRDKDFSTMYGFGKTHKNQEKILNTLALFGHMSKKELVDLCGRGYNLKNVYQYFAGLEKTGAIRCPSDGNVELHSQLFRTAILMGLIPSLDVTSGVGKLWKDWVDDDGANIAAKIPGAPPSAHSRP
jgi:hypothetical protein